MNLLTQETNNIPWHRLTTAYGRGADIPLFIKTGQYEQVTNLIEHQGTLWQVTPWALLLLLKELAGKMPEDVFSEEIELYLTVANTMNIAYMNAEHTVETMNDLLNEKFLWPESEEDDEEWWEQEEPPGYEPEPFLGYYYFSFLLLKEAVPIFTAILNGNEKLAPAVQEMLHLLKPEDIRG